jgi:hypothetical protein
MTAPARARLDTRLLARVLGMLGSDHDGEVAAAGRAAAKLVRDAGISWDAVLDPPVMRLAPPPSALRINPSEVIHAALRRPERLSPWETDFAHSIAERGTRHLSERQLGVVRQLADKLGLRP